MEDPKNRPQPVLLHSEPSATSKNIRAINYVEAWLQLSAQIGSWHALWGTAPETPGSHLTNPHSASFSQDDLDVALDSWKTFAEKDVSVQDKSKFATRKQAVFGLFQYLSGFIDEGREFLSAYMEWQREIITYSIQMANHLGITDLQANLKLIQDDIEQSKPKLPQPKEMFCQMELSFSIPTVLQNKRSVSNGSSLKKSQVPSETFDDGRSANRDSGFREELDSAVRKPPQQEDLEEIKDEEAEMNQVSPEQGLSLSVRAQSQKDPSSLASSIPKGEKSKSAGEDISSLVGPGHEKQPAADGEELFLNSESSITLKAQSHFHPDETREQADALNDAVNRFTRSNITTCTAEEMKQKVVQLATAPKEYLEGFLLAGSHRNIVTDADLALLGLQIDASLTRSPPEGVQLVMRSYFKSEMQSGDAWISVWLQKDSQGCFGLYAKCKDHDYVWEEKPGTFSSTTSFFAIGTILVIMNPEGQHWKIGYFSLDSMETSKTSKKTKMLRINCQTNFELKDGHCDTFDQKLGHLLVSTGDQILQLVLTENQGQTVPCLQQLEELKDSETFRTPIQLHSRLRVVHYTANKLLIILCESKEESKQAFLEVILRDQPNNILHHKIGMSVDSRVDRLHCVVDDKLGYFFVVLQKENLHNFITAVPLDKESGALSWHELTEGDLFFDSENFYIQQTSSTYWGKNILRNDKLAN